MGLAVEDVRRNRDFYNKFWHYCKYCIELGIPKDDIKCNTDRWETHYTELKGRR